MKGYEEIRDSRVNFEESKIQNRKGRRLEVECKVEAKMLNLPHIAQAFNLPTPPVPPTETDVQSKFGGKAPHADNSGTTGISIARGNYLNNQAGRVEEQIPTWKTLAA